MSDQIFKVESIKRIYPTRMLKKIINPKNLPMVHTDKFYMPNIVKVDYIFSLTTN